MYSLQARIVMMLLHSVPSLAVLHIWSLLCAMQVVNAVVFTYDGLLVASAEFTFSRNSLIAGFVAVFLPAIIIGCVSSPLLTTYPLPLLASSSHRLILPCFPVVIRLPDHTIFATGT